MTLMDVTFGEAEAYITLGRGKVARSSEVAPGVVLDLDDGGEAVGLRALVQALSTEVHLVDPATRLA